MPPREPTRAPDVRVGPYRIVGRLGEGGMGVVHLGQGPDGVRVAVKVLRPHVVGDEEARQRLSREVDSLSRVRSPRVAEIIDADPWGPIPYVATRYVPGLSLSEHVREEGPITGPALTRFAGSLAEALQVVHDAGVVHRDIKPSNVLMEGRTPVLIDFGLARVADDARLTRTGWLLGTPGYIAPEVLEGDEPGESADVHGWAATVAFAGLGRSPFGTGPSMAILDRVRRGKHDLAGLEPSLRGVVEAALDPDPARRPDLAVVLVRLSGIATEGPGDLATMPIASAPEWDQDDWAEDDEDDDEDGWDEEPGDDRPTMTAAREPYRTPPPSDWEPHRVTFTERLRRGLLGLGTLLVLAAAAGAAPYLTLALVTIVIVVLRCLSLTASEAGSRRQLRGHRWYDGVLTPLSLPWYLLSSLPATLLLLLWTAILVASTGLVLVALDVGTLPVLWACGLVLGVVAWTGPGADRVRAPLRRPVIAVARDSGATLAALAGVVVAAAVLVWLTGDRGTSWAPGSEAPWLSLAGLADRF